MVFHDGSPFSFPHLQSSSTAQDSTSDLLNPRWQLPASGFAFEAALKQLTADVIRRAMDAEDGNISAAARRLGVPRDFIRYRIGQ
jgi:DNA-binding NtrC family response regulator